MKTYALLEMDGGDALDLIERHASWVPADVAQGLYDALSVTRQRLQIAMNGSYTFEQQQNALEEASAALAAADGKEG